MAIVKRRRNLTTQIDPPSITPMLSGGWDQRLEIGTAEARLLRRAPGDEPELVRRRAPCCARLRGPARSGASASTVPASRGRSRIPPGCPLGTGSAIDLAKGLVCFWLEPDVDVHRGIQPAFEHRGCPAGEVHLRPGGNHPTKLPGEAPDLLRVSWLPHAPRPARSSRPGPGSRCTESALHRQAHSQGADRADAQRVLPHRHRERGSVLQVARRQPARQANSPIPGPLVDH